MSAYRKGLRVKAAEHLLLVKEYYDKYRSRIVRGLATYGEFDPATDKRVLSVEMQEECLDIGSYLEMWDQKYTSKAASTAAQKARAYFILGYGMLKELEELERTLTREGDA